MKETSQFAPVVDLRVRPVRDGRLGDTISGEKNRKLPVNRHGVIELPFDKPAGELGSLPIRTEQKTRPSLSLDKGSLYGGEPPRNKFAAKSVRDDFSNEAAEPKEQAAVPEKRFDGSSDNELLTRDQILAELDEIETLDNQLGAPLLWKSDRNKAVRPHKAKPKRKVEKPSAVVASQKFQQKSIPPYFEDFYFPEVASPRSTPREGLVWGSQKESSGIIDFYTKKQDAPRRKGERLFNKPLLAFVVVSVLIALIIPAANLINRGLKIKEGVLKSSLSAYQNMLAAKQLLERADWQAAEQNFNLAHFDFIEAEQEIGQLGNMTLGILDKLPGGALVSSGAHLVKVGERLAYAGQILASAVDLFSFDSLFELADSAGPPDIPLTEKISLTRHNLLMALEGVQAANSELDQVKISALPDDIQPGVASLKEKLPIMGEFLNYALDYSQAFLKILGHDNPRQYLLIFQNNSEMRATGGFIGTYGLLTLDRGEIKELLIDGVFNADGQLHEKIIPPRPIQKISTAWSMHDANWFADFPTSAQKIAWFYEKTGGPTVDGVISLTPTVIERLLELAGPISMPEYDVMLDAANFVELVQYEVEIDYDKELNRPKKILADFAPKLIDALNNLPMDKKKTTLEIVFGCLQEKHVLAYFDDTSLEGVVMQEGWAGELLEAERDYFSAVSSNINGFKTDRVIEETISHEAEVREDGSVIVTLTVKREHQGGEMDYDWWNRVNANYLRVYLPKGTQLISAKGHTLESYYPPIDYQAGDFRADPLVEYIEERMIIDEKTGIHIFEENNKTVFGSWVYVSPGETVTLAYKYKLPFKIDPNDPDSYSLIAQKQSGTEGSGFAHTLRFPSDWEILWKYPDELEQQRGEIFFSGDLRSDIALGVAFQR